MPSKLATGTKRIMTRNENSKILRVIASSEFVSGGIVFFSFGHSRITIFAAIILWGLAAYSLFRSYHLEE